MGLLVVTVFFLITDHICSGINVKQPALWRRRRKRRVRTWKKRHSSSSHYLWGLPVFIVWIPPLDLSSSYQHIRTEHRVIKRKCAEKSLKSRASSSTPLQVFLFPHMYNCSNDYYLEKTNVGLKRNFAFFAYGFHTEYKLFPLSVASSRSIRFFLGWVDWCWASALISSSHL